MARAFKRIIAVGDLHADVDFYRDILRACELTDSNGRFTATDTAFVVLGNVCDRGPDSASIYRSLIQLQAQAPKRGSRVYALLGKHELMNLFGIHRDSSASERAFYQDDAAAEATAFETAFAPGGWLSRWLVTLPAVVRIDPFIFAPADLPPVFRDLQVADINRAVKQELDQYTPSFRRGDADLPLSLFSPETSILCSDAAGQHTQPDYTTVLHTFLHNNRARVYVCGHTPQTSGVFLKRYEGRYLCIDTAVSFVSQGFGARAVFEWVNDEARELLFTTTGLRRRKLSLPLSKSY
ncbi:MAG: hypothetical protein EA383_06485 [Spirochaetaceae bacterium]|nr:MAG: hypothetical protein EA383_06485 [Spirochaetaceae bacterium]